MGAVLVTGASGEPSVAPSCWIPPISSWTSPAPVISTGLSVLLSSERLAISAIRANAILRLLACNLSFSFGSLFSFVLGVGLYGLTYLYPVFLGRIRGYDSMMIGETLFISGGLR